MSRYAILSDIHGNLEALQTVWDHLCDRNVEGIWFLGDLVGYGPDPGVCIRTLLDRQDWPVRGVLGNNDDAILLQETQADLSRMVIDTARQHGVEVDTERQARIQATFQSYQWTLEQLAQQELEMLQDRLERLQSTPLLIDGAVLMHASPCDPIGREGNYLRTEADAEEAFVCNKRFQIGFFAHTHHAGVFRQFTATRMYDNVEYLPFSHFAGDMQEFPLDDRRVLINPGSIGQPRDGDRRAAYAVYDTDARRVEFYRVEYPIDTTINKLNALKGTREIDSMVDVLVQRLREAT